MMFSPFKIMLSRTLIVLIVSASVFSTSDYYWRPFDGYVPGDAVTADWDGVDSFIGRVPVWNGGLYIGQLYPGKRQIVVTGHPANDHNGVWILEDNIQILCSLKPQLFEWVATDSDSASNVQGKVQGGYQNENFLPLYVGRVKHNGRYVVGKVTSDLENSGFQNVLYIYDDITDHEASFTSYEILTYKG